MLDLNIANGFSKDVGSGEWKRKTAIFKTKGTEYKDRKQNELSNKIDNLHFHLQHRHPGRGLPNLIEKPNLSGEFVFSIILIYHISSMPLNSMCL